jgi:hypothetical protein
VQSTAKLEASKQPSVQRLGLRYTVLQTDPGSLTLAVEVNQDAYLYVLTRDASGAMRLLFPTQTDAPQDALVEQDKRYLIPPTGPLNLEAEQVAPRVVFVLARTPQSDWQGLTAQEKAGGKVRGDVPDALLPRGRSGGKLLREEVIEPRPGGESETTVYVVEAAPSPSSSLFVEIVMPAR